MAECAAIIPLKRRSDVKSRLAARLSEAERRQLAQAMLRDVIAGCRAAAVFHEIVVITPDRSLAGELAQEDVRLLLEQPPHDLNHALDQALAWAARNAIRSALILAADLPLVTPGELRTLLQAGRDVAVAIAPDRRGRGTNALLLRPPDALRPQFGVDSLLRHKQAAARNGLPLAEVSLPGLAFDIDLVDDLEQLRRIVAAAGSPQAGDPQSAAHARHTRALLAQWEREG